MIAMRLFGKSDLREEEGSVAEVDVRLDSIEELQEKLRATLKRLEKDVEIYRRARLREKEELRKRRG